MIIQATKKNSTKNKYDSCYHYQALVSIHGTMGPQEGEAENCQYFGDSA